MFSGLQQSNQISELPSLSLVAEIKGNKIYLGNLEAANNVALLFSHDIKAVLTVCREAEVNYNPEYGIQHLFTPVSDRPEFNLQQCLDQTNQFLIGALQSKKNILVHCFLGKSRSTTVVLAFMMKNQNMNLEQALQIVKSRRASVDPNPGFVRQLLELEKKIYGGISSRLTPLISQYYKVQDLPYYRPTITPPIPQQQQQVSQPVPQKQNQIPKQISQKRQSIQTPLNFKQQQIQNPQSQKNQQIPKPQQRLTYQQFQALQNQNKHISTESSQPLPYQPDYKYQSFHNNKEQIFFRQQEKPQPLNQKIPSTPSQSMKHCRSQSGQQKEISLLLNTQNIQVQPNHLMGSNLRFKQSFSNNILKESNMTYGSQELIVNSKPRLISGSSRMISPFGSLGCNLDFQKDKKEVQIMMQINQNKQPLRRLWSASHLRQQCINLQ